MSPDLKLIQPAVSRTESTDAAWHPLDRMPRLAFAGERAGLAALRGDDDPA